MIWIQLEIIHMGFFVEYIYPIDIYNAYWIELETVSQMCVVIAIMCIIDVHDDCV